MKIQCRYCNKKLYYYIQFNCLFKDMLKLYWLFIKKNYKENNQIIYKDKNVSQKILPTM